MRWLSRKSTRRVARETQLPVVAARAWLHGEVLLLQDGQILERTSSGVIRDAKPELASYLRNTLITIAKSNGLIPAELEIL